MLVIGCTVEESRQAVALTREYPDMFAAVGIHPQELNLESGISNLEAGIKELRTLAQDKKVVAIGECGLEYYAHNKEEPISDDQKRNQKEGFLAQIELAQELALPLILHCRTETGQDDAYQDIFSILKATSHKLPAILHCYMGDTEVTAKFLTLPNIYFSFTGNITYPVKKTLECSKHDLRETVRMIPLERLFTETDCPFLTPQSKRGERNEPAYVSEVLAMVARLHSQEEKVVEYAINKNFQTVFPRLS